MRQTRRSPGVIGVLVAAVLAGILAPGGVASAAVSVSTSMTVPTGVSVGQTNLAGSLTVVNQNTSPNASESNTITQIRVALSCAGTPAATDACPTPDPGVFQINSPATGAAGTACAGVTFTASPPDAKGIVTFTPSSTVSLAPPGSSQGTDRCRINFTFNVLKVPTIDVEPAAGVQTRSNARITAVSTSGLTVTSGPSLLVTVVRATPTLTTQASGSVFQGGTISDTATVTGVPNVAAPTGDVTFRVFGPDDAACSGPVYGESTNPVTGGSAQSNQFGVTRPGTYRFVASYSGDANYSPVTGSCNAANESVTVRPRRAPADFDGDGKSDLALFRPSNGNWLIRKSSGGEITGPYGDGSDIPIPEDYDGDNITDLAVWRPATGTWFIALSSGGSRVGNFGITGDVPVPADYDGDGKADVAVWRPATGTWFIAQSQGGTRSGVYGTSGDIPVPKDYDGDGRVDLAVWRQSSGTWFILRSGGGQTIGAYGVNGDRPVPADYDGDGKADVAVWRPATGTWFVALSGGGSMMTNYGASGDVPVVIPPAIRMALP